MSKAELQILLNQYQIMIALSFLQVPLNTKNKLLQQCEDTNKFILEFSSKLDTKQFQKLEYSQEEDEE